MLPEHSILKPRKSARKSQKLPLMWILNFSTAVLSAERLATFLLPLKHVIKSSKYPFNSLCLIQPKKKKKKKINDTFINFQPEFDFSNYR
jgi:hypothetical protein